MNEVTPELPDGEKPTMIDPSLWLHRIVVKEGPPAGMTAYPGNYFDDKLGRQCQLVVFGERRQNYFLFDAQVSIDGSFAVLTCDLYDLDGTAAAKDQQSRQDEEKVESADKSGPDEGEVELGHAEESSGESWVVYSGLADMGADLFQGNFDSMNAVREQFFDVIFEKVGDDPNHYEGTLGTDEENPIVYVAMRGGSTLS